MVRDIDNFLPARPSAKGHGCTMPFNPHNNVISSSFASILQMEKLMFAEVKLIHGKTEI